MITTNCMLPVLAFIFGMTSTTSAAASTFLDPTAYITVQEPLSEKSTVGGGTLLVKEGALLRIHCKDRIVLTKPWHKDNPGWVGGTHDTPNGFQSTLRINGGLVEIFQSQIPPNTKLGYVYGAKAPYYIDFDHPVVYWVAKGIGNHEIECILDTTTQLPDKNRGNNVTRILVKVSQAKPVAKPPAQPPARPIADGANLEPLTPYVPAAGQARPTRDASPQARSPAAEAPAARAMKAAGCVLEQARQSGRYACPSQAGLDRCERLLAAGEVAGCRLASGR